MKTRAAVAFQAKKRLEIVEVDLEGPRDGEVLVEIMATGICHTDAYTLDGFDSEGIFPSILGHEGAGIVREVGAGVTSVKPGDHAIPLYTPECRQCKSCLSRKTNLCTAIRGTQGKELRGRAHPSAPPPPGAPLPINAPAPRPRFSHPQPETMQKEAPRAPDPLLHV